MLYDAHFAHVAHVILISTSSTSQILKNEATLEKTGVYNRLIDTPYLRMEALVSL